MTDLFNAARAELLAELNEPTEAMVEAGRQAWLESASDYTKLTESTAAAFRAMIAKAGE